MARVIRVEKIDEEKIKGLPCCANCKWGVFMGVPSGNCYLLPPIATIQYSSYMGNYPGGYVTQKSQRPEVWYLDGCSRFEPKGETPEESIEM